MTTAAPAGPIVDVDPATLDADPYPTYAELRRDAPVAFVPALGLHLVTRHEDVDAIARDPELFSSQPGGAATPGDRVVGATLMQKDGEAHRRDRRALDAPLKPRIVHGHWSSVFETNTNALLDALADRDSADLLAEFARPLAASNLLAYLGFEGVSVDELIEWCHGIIIAAGNYADDPDVWARGFAAREAVIAAVDAAVERVRASPDDSVISAMVHAETLRTREQMYSDVMITIGGGLNEPSHALATTTYGLLTNPDQREDVAANPGLVKNAVEEALRWVSPIGMMPRRVTRPVEIAGVQLQTGHEVGLVVASANRDERVHPNADVFDLHRTDLSHIAFGKGPHFCAGAPMARAQVGIALPALLDRLKGLRLDPDQEVPWSGFIFRGPASLRVRWDG